VDVQVVEDPAAVAAERLAAAVRTGAHLVLTGGSTPRRAYEQLAERGLDWNGTTVWFTDERCVPPDHEHSNFGMVKKALLDRVEGAEVHRMPGELGPHDGAAAYEREVRESAPTFDLMLVGLGPDAHVCSLFPGDTALGERERPVVGVETPGMAPLVPRITLTLPAVNAARALLLLVTGEDKAEAVARAFGDSPDPSAPGSLLDRSKLTLVTDSAAASRL